MRFPSWWRVDGGFAEDEQGLYKVPGPKVANSVGWAFRLGGSGMYSVVLMMALTSGGEAVDFGGRRCSGCSGTCHGTVVVNSCSCSGSCSGSCSCRGGLLSRLFSRGHGCHGCHGCHGAVSCSGAAVCSGGCGGTVVGCSGGCGGTVVGCSGGCGGEAVGCSGGTAVGCSGGTVVGCSGH